MLAGCLLALLVAAGVFILCELPFNKKHSVGRLVVDETNPDFDNWTLFIDEPLDDVIKLNYIILKVERRK